MKLDVNGMAEWRRRKLLCHTWAKRRWAGLLNRGRREHGMQEVVCAHLVRKSAGVAIFRKTPAAAGGGKIRKEKTSLSFSLFLISPKKKHKCCCSYNTTTSCRNSCRRRVRRYIWCVLVARPAKDALHRLAAAAREETNVGRWNNAFLLPSPTPPLSLLSSLALLLSYHAENMHHATEVWICKHCTTIWTNGWNVIG